MKLSYTILIFIVFVFTINSQTITPVGKWEMIKHITKVDKNSNYNCLKGEVAFLTLNSNGSYEIKEVDAQGKMAWFTYGNWSISSDNKELKFTVTDWKPKNDVHTYSDRICEIIKLTKKEFVYKEHLCTKDVLGTSYYVPKR